MELKNLEKLSTNRFNLIICLSSQLFKSFLNNEVNFTIYLVSSHSFFITYYYYYFSFHLDLTNPEGFHHNSLVSQKINDC